VELKYFERKLTRKTIGRFFAKVKTSEHAYQNEIGFVFCLSAVPSLKKCTVKNNDSLTRHLKEVAVVVNLNFSI